MDAGHQPPASCPRIADLPRLISPNLLRCVGRDWHIASFRCAEKFGRYWVHSGHCSVLALNGLSANDPTATLAVHCGNGFDVGFRPYQSTRLNL